VYWPEYKHTQRNQRLGLFIPKLNFFFRISNSLWIFRNTPIILLCNELWGINL